MVDVRNPKKPRCPSSRLTSAATTASPTTAHDVQIDEAGVAWVSGAGGHRGYWTKGRELDPVQKKYRVATAFDPVPYAGGKFYQSNQETWVGSLAHNMARPLEALGDHEAGSLALVTIENFTSTCETDGRLLIVDLADSREGQAWSSTPEDPYRLPVVSEWSPFGKPGSLPNAGCSAHYFQSARRSAGPVLLRSGHPLHRRERPREPRAGRLLPCRRRVELGAVLER